MPQGNRVHSVLRRCPARRLPTLVAALAAIAVCGSIAPAQSPVGNPSGDVAFEQVPSSPVLRMPTHNGLMPPSYPERLPGVTESTWDPFAQFRAPGRHQGVGQPLLQESWRYRPFSIGWFMGAMVGSPLIDDWTGANEGFFGGYRLGWDYDHYWGCEFRYGFASLAQWDSARAVAAQEAADDLAGLAPDDPWRHRYDRRRDVDVETVDLSLLYYPWGDAAWRPYGLIGLGSARVSFQDRLAHNYSDHAVTVPLGLGVKYRYNSRVALRLEFLDNIVFAGDGMETLHDLSLTGGVEIRFGGTRKAYWPWNPGRHYW